MSSSVVQDICQEFQNIHSLGFSHCLENLTNSLRGLNIPEEKIREVLNDMKAADIFMNCNSGPLRSEYCRNTYFKERFNHVQPQSHVLGRNMQNKNCSFQYVPILETLKSLLDDDSVWKEYKSTELPVNQGTESCQQYYRDITDGIAFKNNILFKEKPNSLRIILYQDVFEMCNPLGSSRKKHKILGVYMTIANFRPHLRSVVDNTLLVLLCKELDLKYFGQSAVFKKLVEDLKELENNGIHIRNETLKGTVCFIAGDNLGSHGIGGFTENFSTVEYFCRYCTITSTDFHNDPLCIGAKRNSENYNEAISILSQKDNSVSNVNGIKFDSLFNSLKYFHVANAGLPPCLGHDIFEGVGTYDVALILKHLINSKRWFTYEELNQRLMTFQYHGTDTRSKPCQVNVNGEKLGGQAIQNWSLLRLLPVIIHDRIKNPGDPFWQQFLLLHDIVELICSPEIDTSGVAYLAVLIDEYLEQRKTNFPDEKLKPKHHYMKHYPRLISEFGPLIRVWTLRFESKHSYFKQCVKNSQNFINVCQTLSEKHQLLLTYKQAVSFFQETVECKNCIPLITSTYSQAIQSALKISQISDNSEVSTEVKVKGTLYKKGSYVIIGKSEYGLLFGEIQFIIVTPAKVYLLIQEHEFMLSESLHVYIIPVFQVSATVISYNCVELSKLKDYYPLSAYKRGKNLMIPLKHAVSV